MTSPANLIADPSTNLYFIILFSLLGLCVGSFLNVVALRFLSDTPITHPASNCPNCQTPIRPYDNIPLLGWLLLGGKCRSCKQRISVQYPLVELATGILFAFSYLQLGLTWTLPFVLFLLCNLIVIFITDLREKLIFEINSLSLIPAGLIYSWIAPSPIGWEIHGAQYSVGIPQGFISALIAIAIGFIFFEGLIFLSKAAFGTDGFGHGDTHLIMGVGAFLGWQLTLLTLMLGFIIQSIPTIPILIVGWIKNKNYTALSSGLGALLGSAFPIFILNANWPHTFRLIACILCLAVSLISLFIFMRNIRQSENYTYLPLGPALILGSIIALFAGSNILQMYLNYLGLG
jgi:leader peptidase (prepilin peptidase)/N-methyltransferase